MSDSTILLTCASWEDRFRLGVERILDTTTTKRSLIYFFDGFEDWTRDNREAVKSLFSARQVEVVERRLASGNPAANWKQMQMDLAEAVSPGEHVQVDISTMPRELIWTAFWSLEARGAHITYTYHAPARYNPDWLSRDPGKPRLVFKLSGVTLLDLRTALIVVTGYDSQRTVQLIRFYEPERTLVGLQVGDENKGNIERMEQQRQQFARDPSVGLFEIDAFDKDHGQATLSKHVEPLLGTHNVILGSLGPKLTAVAMYRLQRRHPEIGIAYAPSGEFNREYSTGIAESFSGPL